MTLPYFSDRLFYLEQQDTVAHAQYLTSDKWALSMLTESGLWQVVDIAPDYETIFRMLRSFNPVLILEELW